MAWRLHSERRDTIRALGLAAPRPEKVDAGSGWPGDFSDRDRALVRRFGLDGAVTTINAMRHHLAGTPRVTRAFSFRDSAITATPPFSSKSSPACLGPDWRFAAGSPPRAAG